MTVKRLGSPNVVSMPYYTTCRRGAYMCANQEHDPLLKGPLQIQSNHMNSVQHTTRTNTRSKHSLHTSRATEIGDNPLGAKTRERTNLLPPRWVLRTEFNVVSTGGRGPPSLPTTHWTPIASTSIILRKTYPNADRCPCCCLRLSSTCLKLVQNKTTSLPHAVP